MKSGLAKKKHKYSVCTTKVSADKFRSGTKMFEESHLYWARPLFHLTPALSTLTGNRPPKLPAEYFPSPTWRCQRLTLGSSKRKAWVAASPLKQLFSRWTCHTFHINRFCNPSRTYFAGLLSLLVIPRCTHTHHSITKAFYCACQLHYMASPPHHRLSDLGNTNKVPPAQTVNWFIARRKQADLC